MLASPMMTCSRRYFSGSACGSSRVLMIGRFKRRLQADLDLEEVGPLADLEARARAVGADADPAGAADDLAADEERGEHPDDVAERRGARHQVVLVAAVRRALVVGVVLVQVHGRRAGTAWARRAASAMTRSPALSHRTTSSGQVTSGVEYSGWAWSTYSRAPLVRITLARPRSSSLDGACGSTIGSRRASNPRASRSGDSSSKSQRGREVACGAGGVGVDDQTRGQHRVRARLLGHRDAVFGLRAHDAPHTHAVSVGAVA